ncbi:hypothetical protein DUI87_24499 [Hirundo rustica rustica]|uniref:Uncharacterized protein n=1 Tax=Hirundo rustica rustica TaxID=333673 RepID=A0A3M0JDS4_HIRRU|nr:hypothetical protein DUI87_24499 [Hirundo rustica rustica]
MSSKLSRWDLSSSPQTEQFFLLTVPFQLCNEFELHMECRIQVKAPLLEGGGHEDDHRIEAPLLWRQFERIGSVQHGEEKASGRPYSTCQTERDF